MAGDAVTEAERHLVVSVGTGTSVMLVDGLSVTRVGGTALGGGTVMGLGSLLTGSLRFSHLAGLAAEGQRQNVDLRVSDIYRPGEIPDGIQPRGPAARREEEAQA